MISRCSCIRMLSTNFVSGELVIAINKKNRRKLLKLKDEGELQFYNNKLRHSEIIGRQPGASFGAHHGQELTIRRPSLDEYVVLMRRGPAPTYPKDIHAMIAMMDVGQGSRVMEAGAGSGGLTLHLSRTVGNQGRVYSFEHNPDHMTRAKLNYQQWVDSWLLGNPGNPWPENVEFIGGSVSSAAEQLQTTVHAVALDLPWPWEAVKACVCVLKTCGVVSVYLPNITQVVCLADFIGTSCSSLRLEKVMEVQHRQWTVSLASSKHRRSCDSPAEHASRQDTTGTPPYIARPSHHQDTHTAFLVQMRKFDAEAIIMKVDNCQAGL